jgi:hypothetical protein
MSAMTRHVGACTGESAPRFDETYWDHNAAQPVLLIDEATEAITEALYYLRARSVLNDRDLTAAGVALDDLFGGLKQLTDLLPATTRSATGQRSKPKFLDHGQLKLPLTRAGSETDSFLLFYYRDLRKLASW